MTKNGTDIVLVFGTFDILHAEHLHFFRAAKQLGHRLVVIVARDKRAQENKGKLPLHTEGERAEFLRHIDYIDQVQLGDRTDVYRRIREIRPAVIALGYDQHAYVDGISGVLDSISLQAKIVRIRSYFPRRCKSKEMRARLQL